MDGWMDVCRPTFFKSLLLLQFFRFSRNLAHIFCTAVRTKLWNRISKFWFKNFWLFFKISNLDLLSGTAALEQSRSTGLPLIIRWKWPFNPSLSQSLWDGVDKSTANSTTHGERFVPQSTSVALAARRSRLSYTVEQLAGTADAGLFKAIASNPNHSLYQIPI